MSETEQNIYLAIAVIVGIAVLFFAIFASYFSLGLLDTIGTPGTSASQTDQILQTTLQSRTLSQIPRSGLSAVVNNQSALNFNGVNAYVNLTNNSALDVYQGQFTISFWLNTGNVTNNARPVILDDYNATVSIMGNSTNGRFMNLGMRLQNQTAANTADFWTNVNVSLNQWQNWAFVYNGSNGTWYRNGSIVATAQVDTGGAWSGVELNTTTGDTYLARGYNNNSFALNGSLDEVRIYNINLTANQINQIFNASRTKNNTLPQANLVSYYSMNENTGVTAYDTNGGINGTITNATYQTDGATKTLTQNTDYNIATQVFTNLNNNSDWDFINFSYTYNTGTDAVGNLSTNFKNGTVSGFSFVGIVLVILGVVIALSAIVLLVYAIHRIRNAASGGGGGL